MKASDFVRELSNCAPSVESLQGLGLSPTESEAFRAGYICTPRSGKSSIASNELFELTNGWDVSKVEVGMVRLSGMPSDYSGQGTQIGLVEVDPLILTRSDSQIIVSEAGSNGHLLWKVAQTPEQFLGAMVVAARFLSDRTVGTVDFEDLDAAKVAAKKCAELAGGDEYLGFYAMLLGAE